MTPAAYLRALRHRVRELVARVDRGEGHAVNSFDRAVAALEQPVGGKVTLAQLIAEGRVTPALDPNTEDLPMPVASSTGASATEALSRSADSVAAETPLRVATAPYQRLRINFR